MGHPTGLRDLKKARRRQDIIHAAEGLFTAQGVDETTMADIAAAVGVSAPTVFNYFGNKDAILVAIIAEGIDATHRDGTALPTFHLDMPFDEVLVRLFRHVTETTMQIASKRIWRYAEAHVIRHPDTVLAKEYAAAEDRLVETLSWYLGNYDLWLLNGVPPDPMTLGRLFHDLWNVTFQCYIKDEAQGIEGHALDLEARFAPVCRMVFDPAFLDAPRLMTVDLE